MKLHYLSHEEEVAIKKNIPWRKIDTGILELIRFANTIKGLATVGCCEGHIKPVGTGFHVSGGASVAFQATKEIVESVLFNLAPEAGIRDASIRYFDDGSFWVNVGTHPTQASKLDNLFKMIKEEVTCLRKGKRKRKRKKRKKK